MSFNRVCWLIPSRRTVLTVLLSSVAGASLVIIASVWLEAPVTPAPGPLPPRDARCVAVGKTYLPQLGLAYAAAWEEGAKQLEAGEGMSAALDTVARSWSSNRTQLYDRVLTPEFSKIVAESTKDTDLTPAERSAMASAWRGVAQGLGK
jgi:hypothetical protein